MFFTKYFDFIYDGTDVSLETVGPDFIKTMVVKSSKENVIFLDYIKYMNDRRTYAKELSDKREKLGKESADYKTIGKQLETISKEVIAYQKKIVSDNPTALVSKIVKMSMDVEIPEAPRKSDGSLLDSNFAYHYFRDHYFDNIDLNDDRLLSTPVFHNK